MKRSTWIGLAVVGAALLLGGVCYWQWPRLAKLSLGGSAEVGPVAGSADATVIIDMPNVWGDARCRPDLNAPMRTHRTYPGRVDDPGTFLGNLG